MCLPALEQVLIKAIILSAPPEAALTLDDVESEKYKENATVSEILSPQILAISGKEAQIDASTGVEVKDSKTEKTKMTKVGLIINITVYVQTNGTINYSTNYSCSAFKVPLRMKGLSQDQISEHNFEFDGECRTGDRVLIQSRNLDAKGCVQYLYLKLDRIRAPVNGLVP